MTIAPMTLPDMSRKHSMLVIYKHCSHITYLTNYRQKKSKNNIQDMDLSAKCGCIVCANNQHFGMFNLSKISKLCFHTQFKNQNIQILNKKRLISTFYWRTADIYYFFSFFFLFFHLKIK
jgi:hypothetical protein